MSEGMGKATTALSAIPRLEEPHQWIQWHQDMVDLIKIQGHGKLLSREKNPPQGAGDAHTERLDTWSDLQERVCAWIRNRLGHNARDHIKDDPDNASALLDKLKARYRPTGSAVFQDLDLTYSSTTLATSTNVSDYAERLRKARNDILALDPTCVIGEPLFISKFLTGLGPDYDTFLTAFYQSHSLLPERNAETSSITKEPVTFDTAFMRAQQEEQRIRGAEQLAAITRPLKPNSHSPELCIHCHRPYHASDRCWVKFPKMMPQRVKDRVKRHKEMRDKQKQARREKGKEDTEDEDQTPEAAMVSMSLPTTEFIFNSVLSDFGGNPTAMSAQAFADALLKTWLLDSAATSNSTVDREGFITYEPYTGKNIMGYGGQSSRPLGIGTYKLICKVNNRQSTILLKNTVHNPQGGVNLISSTALQKIGVEFRLHSTGAVAAHESRTAFTATLWRNLLAVDLWIEQPTAVLAAYSLSNPLMQIWHERLGHMGSSSLDALQGMSTGIRPVPDSHQCDTCADGRPTERSHKGTLPRGTRPLEVLHMDLWGPARIKSKEGNRYWLTVVDGHTGHTWALPMARKDQLPQTIQEFLGLKETPERRCRFIRLDRGSENRDTAFREWCTSKGIECSEAPTEQHQSNGIAERAHRILTERLNTTMMTAKLPLEYWDIVLRAAVVYLRNLTPSGRLGRTPYEAWTGDKPDLNHLRIIGSPGRVMLTQAKRSANGKLTGSLTEKCRLLGYNGASSYILLTECDKIRISPDVTFNETPVSQTLKRRLLEIGHYSQPTRSQSTQTGASVTDTHTEIVARPSLEPVGEFELPPIDDCDEPPARRVRFNPAVDEHQTPTDTIVVQTEPRAAVRQSNRERRHNERYHPSQYVLSSTEFGATQTNGTQHPDPYDVPVMLLCAFIGAAVHAAEPYEPSTLKQAQESSNSNQWYKAMHSEHLSLIDNKTWTLVQRPKHMSRVLKGKWVYKIKRGPDGEIQRFKARWVVKGFMQKYGIDYNETFASVVKPMSYKALFALAAALDLELHQMDVKTAFLYGQVDEDIYVEQPPGLGPIDPEKVCKLNKALYGLKQSPRIWYETLSKYLLELGFSPLTADSGVFVRGHLFIAVYVDDLLIAGPDLEEITGLKKDLSVRFEMSDLGKCSYYLGMSVKRDRRNRVLYLSQKAYIEKVLKDFDFMDCKPVSTPMDTGNMDKLPEGHQADEDTRHWYARAIGSLMYAMLGTRPDIAYAVSRCSRYLGNPTSQHVAAVKRIFRYLKGTLDLVLVYRGDLGPLTGWTDADWAGDPDTRRSTAGYLFTMGSAPISWQSKRQSVVALSSCEAELMGQTQAAKEAVWLRRLLTELGAQGDTPTATIIYGDNQGAIALAKDPQFHPRTKHVETQQLFVREQQLAGNVDMRYVSTTDQIADGLTKALGRTKFEQFRTALGLEFP